MAPEVSAITIQPWKVAADGVRRVVTESIGEVRSKLQQFNQSREERKAEKIREKIDELEQRQAFRTDMGNRTTEAVENGSLGHREVLPETRRQRRSESRAARRTFKLGVKRVEQQRKDRLLGTGMGTGHRSSRESFLLTTARRAGMRSGASQAFRSGDIDGAEYEQRRREAKRTYVHDEFMHQKKRTESIRGRGWRLRLGGTQPVRYRKTERKLTKLRDKLAKIED